MALNFTEVYKEFDRICAVGTCDQFDNYFKQIIKSVALDGEVVEFVDKVYDIERFLSISIEYKNISMTAFLLTLKPNLMKMYGEEKLSDEKFIELSLLTKTNLDAVLS
jgi:hypothetical protein